MHDHLNVKFLYKSIQPVTEFHSTHLSFFLDRLPFNEGYVIAHYITEAV